METRYQVAIVGGGVGGLAAANAFASRGYKVIVVEKTKAPGNVDRGDVIHQSILDHFVNWKIDDLLASYGPVKVFKFAILNNDGAEIFSIDLSRELKKPTAFTILKHPQIETYLESAAKRSGLVDVRRQEPGVDLLQDKGRIIGVRTNKGSYYADLTVIANGAKSQLRDKYFGEPKTYEYPVLFYNACFKQMPGYVDSGYYVLGKRGVMIMVPLPNGEMRIGIQYRKGEFRQNITAQHLVRVIKKRLGSIDTNKLTFIDGHVYRIVRSISDTWSIPGAVLVGDAAHTVHPAGGQGMNLAFQDAETLASYLGGPELLTPEKADAACNRYSKQRIKEVRKVLRRTHLMGTAGAIRNPFVIQIREGFLRLAKKSRPLKRKVFERITEVR